MITHTFPTTVAGRSRSMRRQRRRTASATADRMYCRTNGCTSFLRVDPATGQARCEICGYTRRNR